MSEETMIKYQRSEIHRRENRRGDARGQKQMYRVSDVKKMS
jgi:hypothetical protein